MTPRFVLGIADVGAADATAVGGGADTVLDRVRSCWASLDNDESVTYRCRRGIGESGLAMGVVVQRPGCSALHGDPADRIVLPQSRPETVWAARDRAPIAAPKPRASDHVLARFRKAL